MKFLLTHKCHVYSTHIDYMNSPILAGKQARLASSLMVTSLVRKVEIFAKRKQRKLRNFAKKVIL